MSAWLRFAQISSLARALPGSGWAPGFLGVVLGTAAQLQQPALWPPWIYAGLLVLTLAMCIVAVLIGRHSRVLVGQALLLLAAGLGSAGLCGLRASAYAAHTMPAAAEGRDLVVTGAIAAMPQRLPDGTRFRLDVQGARALAPAGGTDQDGAAVDLPPRIYLGWYGDGVSRVPELVAGQRWQFTLRLKRPHGNSNPGGFDYELWLWEQGLQATGYVRVGKANRGENENGPRLLEHTWHYPVERLRQQVRDAVFVHVADRRTAGVIAALLVGDQSAIERADWDVFRATGVAHLMSISGLHVTLFAWVAAILLGWLWRRSPRLCLLIPAPRAAALGGLLLAGAYALFSGWGVPAQRTVLMLAVTLGLQWRGARWPWHLVWLAAMAAVLLWDPWAWLSAGFWLSFVAVGVLFATDPGGVGTNHDKGFAAGRLHALLHEQMVVTLALTPLSVLLFGQFSIVGLLANLLAIPWVTLVVTPLAQAGVLWSGAWSACAWCIEAMGLLLGWLAGFSWSSLSLAQPPLWLGVAGVLGGCLLAARLHFSLRALGLPLLLPALLWQAPRPELGQFDLLAADVGQGTAVLLRTATHSLLYDTGPRYGPESDAGHRVLVPLLRQSGERLDTVVLSHRDSDHTGGAVSVFAQQPQAALLSSLDADEAQRLNAGARRCEAGQRWQWDGVAFEILHPQVADYAGAAKSNAMSCVLRVRALNGASVLLSGDIEAEQERRLVSQAAEPLKTDLLIVPHHGSQTSSTSAFLDAVAPGLALAQAGYRNRFGHPAASVRERYDAKGIALVETSRCGAARWRSAQPARLQCERVQQRHYWQHLP